MIHKPMAIMTSGLWRSRTWFSFRTASGNKVGGLRNRPTISVHVNGRHLPLGHRREHLFSATN